MDAYRQAVALSILGSAHSALIPDTLWLTVLDGDGVELDMDRVPVPNDDTTWGPITAGVTNVTPIDLPPAGAGWVIEGWALFDAATGGNAVLSGDLTAPITPADGEALAVPVGGLVVEVAP